MIRRWRQECSDLGFRQLGRRQSLSLRQAMWAEVGGEVEFKAKLTSLNSHPLCSFPLTPCLLPQPLLGSPTRMNLIIGGSVPAPEKLARGVQKQVLICPHSPSLKLAGFTLSWALKAPALDPFQSVTTVAVLILFHLPQATNSSNRGSNPLDVLKVWFLN